MILTEKEINNMPVNLGTLWIIKKSHIEALDKIKELDPYYYISKWEYYEDRADRLAVIADALAAELVAHKPQRCNYLDDIERYYDENNGDEEPEQVAQLFDEAEAAYQAALKAAKEG